MQNNVAVKRAFDIAGASIGLTFVFPICLAAAFLHAKLYRTNLFYKQPRIGLNQSCFTMLKFEIATQASDKNGDLLPLEQRSTFFGDIFKKLKIDEVPQFINVLQGDMSLVGPRPEMRNSDNSISRDELRHTVKPGMTGLSQLYNTKSLDHLTSLQLDHKYVETQSLWQDIKICIQTPFSIGKSYKSSHYH